MEKKDLIFITDSYPFGRGEPFIENEINYLSEKFNQIYIITKNRQDIQTRKVPKNFKIYRINYNKLKLYKILDFYYLKDLFKNFIFKNLKKIIGFQISSKYIEEKIIDVIIQNNLNKNKLIVYSYWFYDGAYAGSILKRKNKINYIFSRAHGYDLYFERGYQPLKEEILNSINYVYSVSKNGMIYLENKYNKNNIGYSYLGTFNKNEFKIKNKGKLIVSCSNLIPLKRVDSIVEILGMLDNKYKELKWIHFGEGPEKQKLEVIAKQKLKNIEYKLVGNISNKNILEFYRKKDILCFIHMSFTEGVPVSMMEAQSFGIPVIATNVGGVSEIINDKVGVLISKNFENKEVIEAIEKIIELSEIEYKRYQIRSYYNWKNNFNAEINYKKLFKKFN